jgi:mono/diheme cytochrome c family protein
MRDTKTRRHRDTKKAGIRGHLCRLSLCLCVFVSLCFSSQASQQPQQANIENGKKAFKAHGCVSCHSYSGQGGAGARLAQNPITFQAFVNYVRRPKGTMPAFGNQVTDTELRDIYAFLKSVPPSPDPKTIPLLNQID